MSKSRAPFRYKGEPIDFQSFIWDEPDIRLRHDSNERQCALDIAEGRDLGCGTERIITRARWDWRNILDDEGFERAQAIAQDITFEPEAFKGAMQCLWPDYLKNTPEFQLAPH